MKLITHCELLNHYQHTIYITVIIQIIVTLHYIFPYIWYNITCTQWPEFKSEFSASFG